MSCFLPLSHTRSHRSFCRRSGENLFLKTIKGGGSEVIGLGGEGLETNKNLSATEPKDITPSAFTACLGNPRWCFCGDTAPASLSLRPHGLLVNLRIY